MTLPSWSIQFAHFQSDCTKEKRRRGAQAACQPARFRPFLWSHSARRPPIIVSPDLRTLKAVSTRRPACLSRCGIRALGVVLGRAAFWGGGTMTFSHVVRSLCLVGLLIGGAAET